MQHDDDDDDSGMNPSMFTDTKSTTFSEVSYSSPSSVVLCGYSCVCLTPSVLGSSGQRDEGNRL